MAFAAIVPLLATIGGGSAVAGGALVATAAAGAVSAYGSIQQGRAQGKQANAMAQEQTIQSNVAATNAAAAGQAANENWLQNMRTRDRALGSQRAAVAASGLAFSGSAADVQADSTAEANREISAGRNADLTIAGNQRSASVSMKRQAVSTRASGKHARRQSMLQAGGTILSTVGNVAGMHAQFS